MHEGNFTHQIVDTVLKELDKYPGKKPVRVSLKVGEVFHLVLDSVQTHFASLTLGTRLQGTRLEMREERVEVHCRTCGAEGKVEDHHLLACLECASLDVEVRAGHEVTVEAIELEA